MLTRYLVPILCAASPLMAAPAAQTLRPVRVHAEGHYLETTDGQLFFWLGDTTWELIHASTRDECTHDPRTRAERGLTVIQTNVLGELNATPPALEPPYPWHPDRSGAPWAARADRAPGDLRPASAAGAPSSG